MQYLPGSLGLTTNKAEISLGELLNSSLEQFKGILGYKIPSIGVGNKEQIPSFIILSENCGIILIDVIDSKILKSDENGEYWITEKGETLYSRDIIIDNFQLEIQNRLKNDISLYNRRTGEYKVNIKKVLVFYENSPEEIDELDVINEVANKENIISVLEECLSNSELDSSIFSKVVSYLEGTKVFETKPLVPINELNQKSDYINRSLQNTFKLDEQQRKVSMQLPQGPQRIRGLAGTGKTVILALKAALTHKDAEEMNILFVFNTQSMYNQIRGLISNYYTYEQRKEPNWDKVKVLHAWGGKYKEGFYSLICKLYNIPPFNFSEVKRHDDPYKFIFSDLLKKLRAKDIQPIFDMVLIDEAQDFPQEFFEIIFYLTKKPKRIIWAYDEFQSLNELNIKEPSILFGKNKDGEPNLSDSELNGQYLGGIDKDYILSNSYRNPRIGLMVGHGLGLGLYRNGGIVDIMSDRKSWTSIGYEVLKPTDKAIFTEGDEMEILRSSDNSKNILETILKEKGQDDSSLVQLFKFKEWQEEYNFIINEINNLIKVEAIPPEQIIVISLASTATKEIFNYIRQHLDFYNIKCITPGYIEDSDKFQEKGFVTLTTPFRAKGNEANIVFVIDSQSIIDNKTFKSRNAIFVAVTRARGWCYITGSGNSMKVLEVEFDKIKKTYPKFQFIFPNEDDVKRRRVILSKNEDEIEKAQQQFNNLLSANKELLIENIKNQPDLLEQLRKVIKESGAE